jgi:hypothetical protein
MMIREQVIKRECKLCHKPLRFEQKFKSSVYGKTHTSKDGVIRHGDFYCNDCYQIFMDKAKEAIKWDF